MTKKFLLPFELVDLIADYHDYDKYCKPQHQETYNNVLSDIYDMGEIMPEISPSIALQCWGSGIPYKDLHDLMDYESYWQEIMNMEALVSSMDEYFAENDNEP